MEAPPAGDGGQATARERALRWAPRAGALAVAAVLVLVAGLVLYDRSLDRVSVDGLAEDGVTQREGDAEGGTVTVEDDPSRPAGIGSPLHVLVMGSDDRDVLTPEERRELSTGYAVGARTEAIALVRIDPERERLDVLRFPRDLLVTRCDGSRGRINAAYGIGERDGVGGATCLVQTIGAWSGLPIHHVVMVDFRGFVDAVDAVGGVEVEIDEPLRDRRAGLDIPAGCVHLDGADALAFVRARHLDDDFGRIDRQQQLVRAGLDQVLTPSTLANPQRLGQLLTTARGSLQFDEHLTARRMRAIASTAARIGSEGMVSRSIDGSIRRSNGIEFLSPHEEHAERLFAAFADGALDTVPETARELEAEAESSRSADGGGDSAASGESATRSATASETGSDDEPGHESGSGDDWSGC